MDPKTKFLVVQRFQQKMTRKKRIALQSHDFYYYSCQEKRVVKQYFEWRCSKHKEGCKALFYTDLATKFYSRFQNFHSCTNSEDVDPIDFINIPQRGKLEEFELEDIAVQSQDEKITGQGNSSKEQPLKNGIFFRQQPSNTTATKIIDQNEQQDLRLSTEQMLSQERYSTNLQQKSKAGALSQEKVQDFPSQLVQQTGHQQLLTKNKWLEVPNKQVPKFVHTVKHTLQNYELFNDLANRENVDEPNDSYPKQRDGDLSKEKEKLKASIAFVLEDKQTAHNKSNHKSSAKSQVERRILGKRKATCVELRQNNQQITKVFPNTQYYEQITKQLTEDNQDNVSVSSLIFAVSEAAVTRIYCDNPSQLTLLQSFQYVKAQDKGNYSPKRPSKQTKLFEMDAMVSHYAAFLDKNYPIQQKDKALQGFKFIKKIGEGSEGEVLLYQDKTGNDIVIKVIQIRTLLEAKPVITEFEIMTQIKVSCVPKYLKLIRTSKELMLFMNYVKGPTLRQIIDSIKLCPMQRLSTWHQLKIVQSMILALAELHSSNIAHRDIKPENMVVQLQKEEITVKLVDFGFVAKEYTQQELIENYGTRDFKSPEVLQQKQGYLIPTDVWSLGMTILDFIFEGLPPLNIQMKGNLRQNEITIMLKWRQMLVNKLDSALTCIYVPESVIHLLKLCLTFEQSKRISTKTLAEFAQVNMQKEMDELKLNFTDLDEITLQLQEIAEKYSVEIYFQAKTKLQVHLPSLALFPFQIDFDEILKTQTISSGNSIHTDMQQTGLSSRLKRKPSIPVAKLREKMTQMQNKYQELEHEFSMTKAELIKIKEESLKRQKVLSVGGSSITTTQINNHYNVNYTNNILQVNVKLKDYLKNNAKHILPDFKPFGLENPNIYCFFLAAVQELQHINFMLTRTLLIKNEPQSTIKLYQDVLGNTLPLQQQDAQECLMEMCEKSCQHLLELLYIKTHKIINCLSCKQTKELQQEVHTQLQLPVENTLDLSLEAFFSFQNLADYRCNNCQSLQCQEQCFLDEVNEIVIVNFMRFNNTGQKDCTKIEIPDKITIKDIEFEFVGCIPHIGKTIQSGHYVKCYKNKDNAWMIINDKKRSKLQDTSLIQKSYICCFKRVNGVQFGPLKKVGIKELDANQTLKKQAVDNLRVLKIVKNKNLELRENIEMLKEKQDEDLNSFQMKLAEKDKLLEQLKSKDLDRVEDDKNVQKVAELLVRKRKGFKQFNNNESDKDQTVIYDKGQENKLYHQHLSNSRRQRRNKSANILKKEDMKEEKLHYYFIELMKEKHALQLMPLNWNFIQKFPLMKNGQTICNEFIDGILYPESLGDRITQQELNHKLKVAFVSNGLSLYNCTQRKTKSYFNKEQVLHKPYFLKLDDNGVGFTVERIKHLQQATLQLETDVVKLDVTIDCQGCLLFEQVQDSAKSSLTQLLAKYGFQVRKDYNQSPTCISFDRGDAVVTIYNKPIQRFETDQLTDKIGNGLQTILGSEQMASKFLSNQTTSFFRIELRWNFDSTNYLSFTEQDAQELYDKSLNLLKLIKSDVYKARIIRNVAISDLWEHLWTQIQSYFVISSKNFVTIVFGQNPYTTKYFGATYAMKRGDKFGEKFVRKFIKVYGLCNIPAYSIIFQDKKRYQLQQWLKSNGNTCLPLGTLFKEFNFSQLHLQNKTIVDFGMKNVGNLQFQPYSLNLSKSSLERGDIIHNTLAKKSQEVDREEEARKIEKRFEKKTKAATPLKTKRQFQYFRFNCRQQSLYMFNPTDIAAKFRYKLPTKEQYIQVQKVLAGFKNKYNSAYVELASGGVYFVDFTVTVTPNFGLLFFEKCCTNESSSSVHSQSEHGDEQQQQQHNQKEESKSQPIEVGKQKDFVRKSLAKAQFKEMKNLEKIKRTLEVRKLKQQKQKSIVGQDLIQGNPSKETSSQFSQPVHDKAIEMDIENNASQEVILEGLRITGNSVVHYGGVKFVSARNPNIFYPRNRDTLYKIRKGEADKYYLLLK